MHKSLIRWPHLLLALFFWMVLTPARAQLSIEITGGGAQRMPVAVSDFAGDSAIGRAIVSVVRADLERSGLFRLVANDMGAVGEEANVVFAEWKIRGADAVAVGSVLPTSDGRHEVRFRLYDVINARPLGGMAYVTHGSNLRPVAHRIADYIHEQLTGEKGVFSTRIAYVVKRGSRYELQVADADGQTPQTALVSREPIISPAWSPDGSRLAYVSFEAKKPIVYVHSLTTGSRTVVANFRGSNSAPAWSPDGRQLAVVLSKEGGSQLFLLNADGSGARRIMRSPGIDTEPFFSPDGRQLYFTSDRGGSPQIYRVSVSGGAAERVTFDGSYNVTPRLSPDGKQMAFVTRSEGRFQLAVMDLSTRQVQIITDSTRDESPSYAPNGRMVLYATEINGRGVLSATSSDGRVRQRLSVQAGDVREPAWGPFLP